MEIHKTQMCRSRKERESEQKIITRYKQKQVMKKLQVKHYAKTHEI